MTVRTIEYLLNKFGAGKSPGSSEYVDLIDTLADDRNAVYFSSTAPEDTVANPLWFNTSTNILSVYSNSVWSTWSPDQNVASQTSWTGAVTLSQIDSLSTYIKKQLTGNTTVTVSSGVTNKTYSCTLELQQDATGSRTIILKGCRTAYGVPLTLTTTASAIDIIRLEWNGSNWTAFMGAAQISVPSSWV
jgi:hypothetical protein